MNAITKLCTWILDNWASIAAMAAMVYAIYRKVISSVNEWKTKSEAEKEALAQAAQDRAIEEAKKALSMFVLSMCAEMERKWTEEGVGTIRRSEVLATIFEKYPILLTVTDQEGLITYIDELINEALVVVREKIRPETA